MTEKVERMSNQELILLKKAKVWSYWDQQRILIDLDRARAREVELEQKLEGYIEAYDLLANDGIEKEKQLATLKEELEQNKEYSERAQIKAGEWNEQADKLKEDVQDWKDTAQTERELVESKNITIEKLKEENEQMKSIGRQFKDIVGEMQSVPPEFDKIFSDKFWEILA